MPVRAEDGHVLPEEEVRHQERPEEVVLLLLLLVVAPAVQWVVVVVEIESVLEALLLLRTSPADAVGVPLTTMRTRSVELTTKPLTVWSIVTITLITNSQQPQKKTREDVGVDGIVN